MIHGFRRRRKPDRFIVGRVYAAVYLAFVFSGALYSADFILYALRNFSGITPLPPHPPLDHFLGGINPVHSYADAFVEHTLVHVAPLDLPRVAFFELSEEAAATNREVAAGSTPFDIDSVNFRAQCSCSGLENQPLACEATHESFA